ncbi:MAG TPA: septal ring lytic transglycosylase RlpA family protein [Xanthobacteraceae bacterium]|jgi:rare lipoprotein A
MLLGKRATLLCFDRSRAKSSDHRNEYRLGVRNIAPLGAVVLTAAALAGCAQSPVQTSRSYQTAPSHQAWLPGVGERHRGAFAATQSLRHSASADRSWQPANEKKHRHSDPVTTASLSRGASVGVASFYTEGVRTASGERLNPNALTAAHPTLPFGTRLRITSVADGRSVVVRVNDRGPFIKGRAVDVSYSAAKELGLTERGVAKVKMEVVESP